MRHAALFASVLIMLGTVIVALASHRGEGIRHTFPDASRRPPLRVILADAESHLPNDRVRAARFLGFYRSEPAFHSLITMLEDPDVLVRLSALRGVRLRSDARAISVIEKMQREDPEEIVRIKAEMTLDALADPLGLARARSEEP